MPKEPKQESEWNKLKNKKKKVILPEPPKEASENLRQIEIPYTRNYRPRYTMRTGRVVQFATRVTPEFDKKIRELAQTKKLQLAVMLEEMLKVYLAEKDRYNFEYKKNKNADPERERERESKNSRNSRKNKKPAVK
jgi:hypothetical protein